MDHKVYHYWLSNRKNIGPRKIEALLCYFGNVEEIFHASRDTLADCREKILSETGIKLLSEEDLTALYSDRDPEKLEEAYGRLIRDGIFFITKEEEQYPDKLRQIYAAPFSLYIKGSLPAKETKCLSVIGARECSQYGSEMARYLAGAVAKEGVAIISGLARGIDTYSHQGALSTGGLTYGVLGCGIDICYPQENIGLYMDMQQHGGILSEYAPGVKPLAGNFPMRNRIISGISDAILVIEARAKSGSLITVDLGLDQGKDIFALPGRVTDTLSEGCNNLLKLGAKPVTSPKDILEELLPGYSESAKSSLPGCRETDPLVVKICSGLTADPKHIEEIALTTGLPLNQLMEQLLYLELKGMVRQTRKNYYCIS